MGETMKRLLTVAFGTLLLLVAMNGVAHAEKPVLGVADFTNEAHGAYWWRDGVGHDLAGMLTNELAAIGSFTMVERSKIESVLAEQNLNAAGRIAPGTGADIGRLTGAQYIVLGTVTAFEGSQEQGAGIGYKGLRLGGKRSEAYLAVDVRVVDSTTGEIAHVKTIEGRAGGRGVSVGGYRGGYSGSLATEEKTPVGEAIRAAVIYIGDYLDCVMVQQDGCEAEFAAQDSARREKKKGKLKLD